MSVHEERKHFNRLWRERKENGFIPDLENMVDCDYFYLSPFRRKFLANLALRKWSDFRIRHLAANLPKRAKVLDIGCGCGWFSLELARAGFNVTGVDLSEVSIELAKETLKTTKLAGSGGSVAYHAADLTDWRPKGSDYDAVCYVGILHHLEDPESVIRRIKMAITPRHFMVSIEPFPDNYGRIEAAIALLIRGILSATGCWYEKIPLPRNRKRLDAILNAVKSEYANWADKSESNQSPMNNATNGKIILNLLRKDYKILARQDLPPLYQRLIGGIRLGSDEQNFTLAKFITQIEEILLREEVLKPGAFNIFGRAK